MSWPMGSDNDNGQKMVIAVAVDGSCPRGRPGLWSVRVKLQAMYARGIRIDVRSTPPPDRPHVVVAGGMRLETQVLDEARTRVIALGLRPDQRGERFVARGRQAVRFLLDGIVRLPDDWEVYVADSLVS